MRTPGTPELSGKTIILESADENTNLQFNSLVVGDIAEAVRVAAGAQ